MNFDSIKKALADSLSALGITEYEVYYSSDSDLSVGTLNGEVNSFTSGNRGGICLRVLVEGKMGYASTELMTEDEMIALAERALSNAKATEKPDLVGIFHGSESYEKSTLPPFAPKTAGELRSAAEELSAVMYESSDKIQNGTSTQALNSAYNIRIFNSHGLDLSTEGGVSALVAEAVVADKGESQVDYTVKEFKGEGKALFASMAEEAIGGALDKIGAATVPTGKYNVVISGKTMRSILAAFSSVFSAKMVLEGMSLLKGKVGEKIASEVITITDDPMREGNSVGTTFDAEGVAAHRKAVVEKGVLTTLLHNRETAHRMGVETTANASKGGYSSPIGVSPYSFHIEPGDKTEQQLLESADEGIYITELKGLHAGVNAVTGDYSLESAGFMIRDGKRKEAVKTFTVAGNFFETLLAIEAVADKVETGVPTGFTSFGSPAVLIRNVSIAGS